MTVESITKYELSDINQCELNANVGFNIDKALEHINFQHPNILYLENVLTKAGIEMIESLLSSGKLILSEIYAQTKEEALDKIYNSNLKTLQKYISRLVFVDSGRNIKIIDIN
ncbi:MAG: hypothetical protein MZU95_04320 [Desulfomicrobium escambiense]|nr:hypothetical protein [Desulfomicrobium escambiense]